MSLITLEQVSSDWFEQVAVKQTISNKVKFIKSVLFFEGKIKRNALSVMEANIKDFLIPEIRKALDSY